MTGGTGGGGQRFDVKRTRIVKPGGLEGPMLGHSAWWELRCNWVGIGSRVETTACQTVFANCLYHVASSVNHPELSALGFESRFYALVGSKFVCLQDEQFTVRVGGVQQDRIL